MGRKQKRAAATIWRGRLARFRRSKLTVVEFCRQEGVSSPSFYQWRKRLEQAPQGTPARTVEGPFSENGEDGNPFVPLAVLPAMAEVELPHGIRIRVPATNAQALRAAVLAAKDLCQEEDESC
jgi:transposase-like protein